MPPLPQKTLKSYCGSFSQVSVCQRTPPGACSARRSTKEYTESAPALPACSISEVVAILPYLPSLLDSALRRASFLVLSPAIVCCCL